MAGSSAAATAWRSVFREKGSFSGWNGRYRMREHREERRVGLHEGDLDGPRVGRTDLLHDAGCAAEKSRPRPPGDLGIGAELAVEADGDVQRGERTAVVKPDALAQRE